MIVSSEEQSGMRSSEDSLPASESHGAGSTIDGVASGASGAANDPGADSSRARSDRERTFARRALIQAGWTVPVITALAYPRKARASESHPFIDHHDFTDRHRGP
jgi:hypothetical protein